MKKSKKMYAFILGVCVVSSFLLMPSCQNRIENGTVDDKNSDNQEYEMEYQDSTFKEYGKIVSGFFEEKSETNFDKVIVYDLTEEDVDVVKDALSQATLTENVIQMDDTTYKYRLRLYDENGDWLFWFVITQDYRIIINSTEIDSYEVSSTELQDWIKDTVEREDQK